MSKLSIYPEISIISVNYNNSKGLQETILSVQAQTFQNYEHIIIDANSTDDSKKVIILLKHDKLIWISEPDKGIYDGMNKGAHMARGKYLQFLNSGDIYVHNNSLETLFAGIISNPSNDFYFSNIFQMDEKKIYTPKIYKDILSDFYLCIETINHQSQIISKDLFNKLQGYNLSYKLAADYDFYIRAVKKIKCSYKHLNEFSIVYNTGGVSGKLSPLGTYGEEKRKIIENYLKNELSRYEDHIFFQKSNGKSIYPNYSALLLIQILYFRLSKFLSKYYIIDRLIYFLTFPFSYYANKKDQKIS